MDFSKFNIIIPPQDIEHNPQCLAKIAAGDRKAYEWLYKNYYSKIYEYALLLTSDKHTSDDIVQEIFLKIWLQRTKLTEITNFNSWIFSTARNLITDIWRKRTNEKQVINSLSHTIETQTNVTPFKHEPSAITHAVNALTERQQLIYKLIREEGRTRHEISEALNISPNTIRNTMQSALHNIKTFVLQNKHL